VTAGLNFRFILVCAGVWLYSVDVLVTATIAPSMVAEIGGIPYINWTLSLYEVGAIIAGAAAAALCRRFGVKRVLIAATLLYCLGCVLAAVALNMPVLLAGRMVQGLGGGMLLSLCYVATYEWFPQSMWKRLFGIVAIIWGAGSLLGPLIGGVFAHHDRWRGCFWFFAIQAVALWLMAARWLPAERPAKREVMSLPVLPLIVLSAATLVVGQAGILATPTMAIGGCVLGVGLLYIAARLDRRAVVRLLPAQLLDFSHPLGAGLLMVFSMSLATAGFWTYGPLLLDVLFETDPLVSGYILAAEALAWSLATVAVGRLPASAEVNLIRIGVCIAAAGATGFAFAVPSGSLVGIVACAIMQGAGFGLCWPSIAVRTVRFADDAEQALASAAPSTVQRIGYAVGTAAAGIAANLSGLVDGVSVAAAKVASFWVFAGFIPVLAVSLLSAWVFTREAR
jgi:MFS family permease